MHLFTSPIAVGHLTLKNRLVMPPMATAKSDSQGGVTEALCEYYAEKSQGGYLGLVITEHSFIAPEGKASRGQLSIARDEDVEGLSRLTGVLHGNLTPVFAQLNHAGSVADREVTGCAPRSASAVRSPRASADSEVPQEMTQAQIDDLVEAFAAAALRAKRAGFDGVEIHSAHGYLLNQFYSPLTNHRQDRYTGATLEGRIWLHLEVLQAVRRAVGPDYPVALRLGACDYLEGGTTLDDSVAACRELEKAGVDLLDISGGFCGFNRPGAQGQGYFSELTEAIKGAVSVPVILTGGITDPAAAEELLQAGKADLIGVGRAILKDSHWPQAAMEALRDLP